MKGSDWLVAGAVVVGGYLLYKEAKKVTSAVASGIASLENMPAAAFSATAGAIAAPLQEVKQGVITPGGLLGKDSATDVGKQTSNFISTVSTGINTQGGLLGAQSATDIGFQLKKLFGGLFG